MGTPGKNFRDGAAVSNDVVFPDLAIIDAHHHLWVRPESRYLIDDFAADLASGHRVESTVFIECSAMYRRCDPTHLRCVGEAEFVAGMASMADSGLFGDTRICAAFVGGANLSLGAAVDEVLDALSIASGGRLRGIRGAVAWDADPRFNAGGRPYSQQHQLMDTRFREGVEAIAKRGLVYDAWQFHPQLPELASLADAFPDMPIVVNHCGGPLGGGRYVAQEVFPVWRSHLSELAHRPNVVMKLGGMARKRCGFDFEDWPVRPTAHQLADAWRPYIETCIELFGTSRCMFGSNFPPDKVAGSYCTVWNALKLTVSACSPSELDALFRETAKRIYRIA